MRLPELGGSAAANPASALMYYKARYYDPHLGRFIEGDPIGTAGGMNIYEYVGGDPMNLVDLMG